MMSPNHALISLLRGLWECDGPSLSPFGLRFFASYHFFLPIMAQWQWTWTRTRNLYFFYECFMHRQCTGWRNSHRL